MPIMYAALIMYVFMFISTKSNLPWSISLSQKKVGVGYTVTHDLLIKQNFQAKRFYSFFFEIFCHALVFKINTGEKRVKISLVYFCF